MCSPSVACKVVSSGQDNRALELSQTWVQTLVPPLSSRSRRTNSFTSPGLHFFFWLLVCVWLCWVSCCTRAFLNLRWAGAPLQLWCAGLPSPCLLCCGAGALGHEGVCSRGLWAQRLWLLVSRAQAQYLWPTGLAAARHVGSSRSGIKPVSPASAGGFFTTEPPGKPGLHLLRCIVGMLMIVPVSLYRP